jgi:quinoprotein relay system zinc metallohydrolase 2
MNTRTFLTRREVLIGGACLCSVPAGALVKLPFKEVAPSIFVCAGKIEEADARNANGISNVSFIIGRDAVAVFDPGGSQGIGRMMSESIRERTRLPVRYVVLSHVHPDHIFGAGFFAQHENPVFVGHQKLPAALAQRGEYYQKRLAQQIGDTPTGEIVAPTMLVNDKAEIDVGGRKLILTAHPTGHSDCDLSMFDEQTATLFAGDILFVDRVPSLDGSLLGWLKQLAVLKSLPAQRAVPGHGPEQVPWPAGAANLERYLDVLLTETRAAIAKGLEITEAVDTVGQSERGKWKLFDAYHGHNVTKAFKELEWE